METPFEVESSVVRRPAYVLRALELFAGYGDREAIVGIGWDGRWTYAQTRAMVLDLAARLRAAGFEPGMTVAIVIAHPPEGPMLQLALHLLGCRSAWLEPDAPDRDMRTYLELTRPDRLIYDTRTRHRKRGKEVAEILGVPVRCLGPDGLGPDLLGPAPADLEPFDLDSATGDVESIFQTTGTTGTPKLIRHDAGLYEQMSTIGEDWVATRQPMLRYFSLTPMWHAAGQAIALLNLVSGGVLFVLFRFVAEDYLAAIEEHRATSMYISPLMLGELLDHPNLATTDCSSIEQLNIGGSPIPATRLRQAIERFGPVVRMTYGLSELPYISALPALADDDRLLSCGQPYGDVRLQIRDEQGAVLPAGEAGEVWASSRLAFHGYLGQPTLTQEAVVDGWIRTRDLGYTDKDGYLYLVGRTHDMIITGLGGEHVFPRPIEESMAAHPGVREVSVFGVPDEQEGEVPHAYVVVSPGAAVTAEELTGPIVEQLGEAWVPRVEFTDNLPRTANGKIDVRSLKARWAEDHDTAPIGAAG